tara:strand:+ start:327 stop:782 length:456 start_codon:yes stop_codon:yes gene_type:complete
MNLKLKKTNLIDSRSKLKWIKYSIFVIKILFATFIFGLMPKANAGIYIFPLFNKGIEVRCLDNEPKHLISFKAGRVMKFIDDGEEKYRFPKTYLFGEKPNENYFYFPSTTGKICSFRKLKRKERENYIKMALDTCRKSDLITRRMFCNGWN